MSAGAGAAEVVDGIDPHLQFPDAYHREATRQTSAMPEAVQQLLPRLRNPEFTRVLIVTLPEATPVHEAAQLQRDLRRAENEP